MKEQLIKCPRLPTQRGKIVQSVGQVHLISCEQSPTKAQGREMARKDGHMCGFFQWGIKCMNHGYHLIQTFKISSFLLVKMCPAEHHYFKPSES